MVEVDGGIHETQKDYDTVRSIIINTLDIRVIRFGNQEVLQDLPGVKAKLTEYLATHPPAPSLHLESYYV